MTDSPINLDEANEIIEAEKTCQRNEGRYNKDRGVAIRLQYLESIVSELETGRERIADLESQVNDNQGNIDDAFEMGCKKVGCIIPQADDADSLSFMLEYLCDDPNDNRDPEIDIAKKVLRRYLAAIEGAKP